MAAVVATNGGGKPVKNRYLRNGSGVTNKSAAELQNAQGPDTNRFWVILPTGSGDWSNNSILNEASGVLAVGVAANNMPALVPLFVDKTGKNAASAATKDGVLYNPNAMWMCQDSLQHASQAFSLITLDAKFAMYPTPGSGSAIYPPMVDLLSADDITAAGMSSPGFFLSGTSQNKDTYWYSNLQPQFNSDLHLGFNMSASLITLSGMEGTQLGDGESCWLQIRSLPLMTDYATSLASSNNICAFENPQDMMNVATSNKMFCCDNDPIQLQGISKGCASQATYERMLRTLKFLSSSSLSSSSSPSSSPSSPTTTGGYPGLVFSAATNSYRLPDPWSCAAPFVGRDIISGQCVCPPGTYGPSCQQQTGSNANSDDDWFGLGLSTSDLLIGGGILFGISALVYGSVQYYKRKQKRKQNNKEAKNSSPQKK